MLAPTRELAKQTADESAAIAPELSTLAVYGGMAYDPQLDGLRSGTDIIVGTPGRISDLMKTNRLSLDNLKFVVLDEADRMFDMGFQEVLEEIIGPVVAKSKAAAVKTVQVLLFSATMGPEIQSAVHKYTDDKRKSVDLVGKSHGTNKTSVTVKHYAMKVPWHQVKKIIPDIVQVGTKQTLGTHSPTTCYVVILIPWLATGVLWTARPHNDLYRDEEGLQRTRAERGYEARDPAPPRRHLAETARAYVPRVPRGQISVLGGN